MERPLTKIRQDAKTGSFKEEAAGRGGALSSLGHRPEGSWEEEGQEEGCHRLAIGQGLHRLVDLKGKVWRYKTRGEGGGLFGGFKEFVDFFQCELHMFAETQIGWAKR